MVTEEPFPAINASSSTQLNFEIYIIYVVIHVLHNGFLRGFCFPLFAANPISAVTEFVAQLAILELLDNVCILCGIWKLAVVSIYCQ
jgi:hypothetical protein